MRTCLRAVGLMLCQGLLAALAACNGGAFAADPGTPLQVACAPDRPLLHPRESVTVRAWVSDSAGRPTNAELQFDWRSESGNIAGTGNTVQWTVSAAPVVPGNSIQARANVSVRLGLAAATECELQVLIVAVPPPDDDKGPPLFGRSFLVPKAAEPTGYGLTTYLLIAATARDDEERQRHLKAIEAVLRALPAIEELRGYRPPGQLNITLLPVTKKPSLPKKLTLANLPTAAQEVLKAYDHTRARVLLAELGDAARPSGPYLVSRTVANMGPKAVGLVFDMSHVEPRLVNDWIDAFCELAGQEHSWTSETLTRLSLNARNAFAYTARATPDVVNYLEQWVRLLNVQ